LLYDNTLGDLPRVNFEAALDKHHVQPAGIEQFRLFTGDFGAQLQRLNAERGDCLFLWGVAESAANVVRALDRLGAGYVDAPTAKGGGWRPHVFGWPAGTGEKRWAELAGDAAKTGTLTTWNMGGLVAQPSFPIRDWMQRYLGRLPTGGEEAPANCYWALLEAVRRAGSTDRARVVTALEGLRTTFAGLEFGFTSDRHLALTDDDLVLITLERASGPAPTDPPYVLGREFVEVWGPDDPSYVGPTHLVRPTLAANRRAHPAVIDRILEEGWGTICTVRPPDRHGRGVVPTAQCKIH
jgi:hypothetical protein